MDADPNATIDRVIKLLSWAEQFKDPQTFQEIRRTLNIELRQDIDRFIDQAVAQKLNEVNDEHSNAS